MADLIDAPCHDGVLRAGACPEAEVPPSAPWVLAVAVGGSGLAFLVGSVVNVALPALQRDLGASVAEVQWVLNAYLLALGALILVGGAAGDRLGRRRVFVAGLVGFTVASLACGLAPTTGWLVAARAAQGVAAAFLVPTSLALVSAVYPKGEARGRAIGTWAGFSALTTALGPVAGGWLVDAFSWRWVFFLVLPPALLTLGLALWRVPASRPEAADGPLDLPGAALAASGFGVAVYGLVAAGESGWGDPVVLGCVAGGLALLGAFVWRQARAEAPMMPLDLFRSRAFSGANGMTLLLYFALNGVLFFLPFNLIQVQGYSAAAAGAAFLPFSLAMGGLSRWSGGWAERWGARRLLVAGPLVTAVGFALLALPGVGGSYWTTFFPPMLVLGVGMTLAVAPLTNTVMSAVDDAHAGTASGVNNAAARIAALLAVAVFGVVALGTFNAALDDRLGAEDASPRTEAALEPFRTNLTGAEVPASLSEAERRVVERVVGAAFVEAFRWTAGLATLAAVLSALVAGTTIRPDET
ncbi:MAG: MFS transporter [Bacteroidota bacterium]